MSAPLLSVIIPVRNYERYIGAAIESVLAQSFQDWELIIVDDCSTDRTNEIAARYQDGEKVRLVRNERNLGQFPTHNRGAELARGKYLKFFHGDDLMYPHCLEIMVTLMEAFPEAGLGISNRPWPWVAPHLFLPAEAWRAEHAGQTSMLSEGPSGTIFRRTAFEEVGGFDPRFHTGDAELNHRMALEHPILALPTGLWWYRTHEGQVSRTVMSSDTGTAETATWLRELLADPRNPLPPEDQEQLDRKVLRDFWRVCLRHIKEGKPSLALKLWRLAGLSMNLPSPGPRPPSPRIAGRGQGEGGVLGGSSSGSVVSAPRKLPLSTLPLAFSRVPKIAPLTVRISIDWSKYQGAWGTEIRSQRTEDGSQPGEAGTGFTGQGKPEVREQPSPPAAPSGSISAFSFQLSAFAPPSPAPPSPISDLPSSHPSPLVSVLIPAYNAEAHLAEAIESVLAQRFTDWELIIVDDASTDRTAEIAQKYADGNRIRFCRNERNLGKWPNHNRCAEFARGKYLKFLHADDLLYPHCLSLMAGMMEYYPEAALGVSGAAGPYREGICLDSKTALYSEFFGTPRFLEGPTALIIRTEAFRTLSGFRETEYPSERLLQLRLGNRWPMVLVNRGAVFYRGYAAASFLGYEKWGLNWAEGYTDIIHWLQEPGVILSEAERREAAGNLLRYVWYRGNIWHPRSTRPVGLRERLSLLRLVRPLGLSAQDVFAGGQARRGWTPSMSEHALRIVNSVPDWTVFQMLAEQRT